ncbi:MAG: DUF2141 domain-containing protein, partial [Porticoccaceae bacterium]|nr:DUF2141 domain-containing protein [Porticoccaceae bacterium]
MRLYKNSNGFPEINHAYKSIFPNVTKKYIQYNFPDVPSGGYAIAVFHDSNNDEELHKNFLWIPKEGYGFSKKAASTFGPPHFDEAKLKPG